jgi:menaquinone-dependent protoporphyrinogen IX oxidase
MKTLIVYGTRNGATAGTSNEIAVVLRQEGFDVEVVDAKRKSQRHFKYELIVVGSGMQMGK